MPDKSSKWRKMGISFSIDERARLWYNIGVDRAR